MNKIKVIGGNLLDFPSHCPSSSEWVGINCIAHSCNTLNIMGGRIAKQIKERYPEAWDVDAQSNSCGDNVLGGYSETKTNEFVTTMGSNKLPSRGRIFNLYTQSSIGNSSRHVNYEALYTAFSLLSSQLGCSSVLGLPYGISCGLAGGSWKIVEAMINDVFLDSDGKTYIVKYDDLGKGSPSDWQKSSFERVG